MQLCLKLTYCLMPAKHFVFPFDFDNFYEKLNEKTYKTLKSEKYELIKMF